MDTYVSRFFFKKKWCVLVSPGLFKLLWRGLLPINANPHLHSALSPESWTVEYDQERQEAKTKELVIKI